MELYPLGATHPAVQKFVFYFDPARQDHQLAHWPGLFHVNPVVDGDARLQLRDIDKSSTQILTQSLELGSTLLGGARGPGFQPEKNERRDCCKDDHNQRQGTWPGDSSRS